MNMIGDLASLLGLSVPVSLPRSVWFDRTDGGRLHAQHWGDAGPRVLLLHGGAQSAQTWTMCSLLLQADYQCVAVDLRGHGDSDWADDYSVQAHLKDIGCAIEQLGWPSAHLVGMSLGGVVAAHYTLTSNQSAIRSLSLVDVAPGVSFADIDRMSAFINAETVHRGVESLVAEARRMGARQSDTELNFRYSSLIRQTDDGSWRWKRDERVPVDYAHILNHIELLRDNALKFRCPCLIVRGGRSRILSDRAAREFADQCPGPSMVTIEGAGHSVQEDNPISLVRELKAFWGNLVDPKAGMLGLAHERINGRN